MTDTGLVLARFASYLLLLAATGLVLHALLEGRRRLTGRERVLLAAIAGAAGAASVWWALASIAAMAGLATGDLDRETVGAVLAATPLGTLLGVRGLSLLIFAALLALRPAPRLLVPAVLPALARLAWAGHSGAGEGLAGEALRLGDVVHLSAAALWLGALFAFLAAMRPSCSPQQALLGLSRFARTGTVVVAALFVTGIADAALISGGSFPSGTWPALITVKAALFAAMLGLAARNRWQLVPALERSAGPAETALAAARLRHSLAIETACAVAIVAVVAIAGQLDPHG